MHRALTAIGARRRLVKRCCGLRGPRRDSSGAAHCARPATSSLPRGRRAGASVLLSDCRATDEEDPVPAAAGLAELLILAPADDCAEAAALAEASGSRYAAIDGADSVPTLLEQLLA